MSETIKESELRVWHQVLRDDDRRMNEPDQHYGELFGHLKTLARLEIIDLWELRDLMDKADAAHSHAIAARRMQELCKARK